MGQEYTLEIKSKNGIKHIYADFPSSNRKAAISLLDDVLQAIEAYRRKSASRQEPLIPTEQKSAAKLIALVQDDQSGASEAWKGKWKRGMVSVFGL